MNLGARRALEFDRIVAVVTGLGVTPLGRNRLAEIHPATEVATVVGAQRATSEGVRFLTDHQAFPLRAPADLEHILEALGVDGRALEPLRLVGLADYLESTEQSRSAVARLDGAFPILKALAATIASFRDEVADVRRKIEPSGEVADNASAALGSIRERLRRRRALLRTTLESFLRGSTTSKYLQEQVVTDRNGRYVLIVRAEHRGSIPGIVHGGSASGASLFVEPLETVEVNNDIVALEELEAEEVRRILLALTDAFRERPEDLSRTFEVATELDVIQARARFSQLVDGVEPAISTDGRFELRAARHPLLMRAVNERLDQGRRGGIEPVPVDVILSPPTRVLVITGPNTGGKTVALKNAGLLAAMAQAGLHIPAEAGSMLPVFRSLFADIGDEQSISASLSTFSGHITNVISMDRDLALPALVLLDEVGAGTDPAEGGALGIAVIDHFRQRGAHLLATTHYDSLKSYASTTDGVVSAAFGFDPQTFAPTYRLIYGSPGRSLAIEIAARLGMPARVIAAAREGLSDRERQLADHLARLDEDLRALEQDRLALSHDRATVVGAETRIRAREEQLRDREETLRRRQHAKVDERVRDARKEIDAIVDGLKARATELSRQAGVRLRTGDSVRAAGISTGDTGAARANARAALDAVLERLNDAGDTGASGPGLAIPLTPPGAPALPTPGARVVVLALGLEGTVIDVHGSHADVDVRGKRLRAAFRELRVMAGAPAAAKVSVNLDLRPRDGLLSELNVIGHTVDEALARLERFLDESTVTDLRELRIVHGHGTGRLRRAITAFLKDHPLVARVETAPENQGGGGATIVELKD
jgi:DNA mismatch repair protein MutS2